MRQALTKLFVSVAMMISIMAFASARAQDKTVLISFPKASYPFFQAVRAHAELEARRLGVRLLIEDGKGDSSDQAADIENAIAAGGVDGILVAPNDVYALVPTMNYVLQRGIPVVTFDTHVYGTTKEVPHVGVDNVDGGRLLAQWVVRHFPAGARVMHLTGLSGSSSGIERARGVRDGLNAGGSQFRIVAEASANWSRTEGMMVTEGQLTFLPELPDAIIANNDDMAIGAVEALRQTGHAQRGVKVIGFDALPSALQALRDGVMVATVDQKPGAQIRTALRMMNEHLRSQVPLRSVKIAPVLIEIGNLQDAEVTPSQ